jgi:hypothetical protein
MDAQRTAKRREPAEKRWEKTAENRCGRNAAGYAQKRWTKKSPLL